MFINCPSRTREPSKAGHGALALLLHRLFDRFTIYNMLWLLLAIASSRQTISQVLTGTWNANVVWTSDNSAFDPVKFEVVQSTGANFLETLFDENLVQINLSYVNLSGNITYMDEVYDFDFTMKVPPFVSTNIDMGELGLFHVTLASYTNIHVVFVDGARTISILLNKEVVVSEGNPIWALIVRNKTGVIGFLAFLLIQFVFRYAVGRLQSNAAREIAQKRAQEKKAEDKEEEEQQEQEQEKERVPDSDGKVKTE